MLQAKRLFVGAPASSAPLEVQPILDRTFTADENRVGADVYRAVLSESLWQQTFGGDPRILGARFDCAAPPTPPSA